MADSKKDDLLVLLLWGLLPDDMTLGTARKLAEGLREIVKEVGSG